MVEEIIARYIATHPDFFFIQIGSNDGVSGDPIHELIRKNGWRGIFVEPVPYLFEKLKKTYAHFPQFSDFIFEHAAIAETDGTKPFYRIAQNDNPQNPFWYDQLGSFRKEIVEKHRGQVPNFDHHFIIEEIECITFLQLIEKHSVKKIDFLHIDTEGYDFEIIKTIPFDAIKPNMIWYEHRHLKPDDMIACSHFLAKRGYSLVEMPHGDTFAIMPECLKSAS